MAQLIERVGKQTIVEGKPIDLGELVNVGLEFIKINFWLGKPNNSPRYATEQMADRYGYSYVLLSQPLVIQEDNQTLEDASRIFIATFYNKRK